MKPNNRPRIQEHPTQTVGETSEAVGYAYMLMMLIPIGLLIKWLWLLPAALRGEL